MCVPPYVSLYNRLQTSPQNLTIGSQSRHWSEHLSLGYIKANQIVPKSKQVSKLAIPPRAGIEIDKSSLKMGPRPGRSGGVNKTLHHMKTPVLAREKGRINDLHVQSNGDSAGQRSLGVKSMGSSKDSRILKSPIRPAFSRPRSKLQMKSIMDPKWMWIKG